MTVGGAACIVPGAPAIDPPSVPYALWAKPWREEFKESSAGAATNRRRNSSGRADNGEPAGSPICALLAGANATGPSTFGSNGSGFATPRAAIGAPAETGKAVLDAELAGVSPLLVAGATPEPAAGNAVAGISAGKETRRVDCAVAAILETATIAIETAERTMMDRDENLIIVVTFAMVVVV